MSLANKIKQQEEEARSEGYAVQAGGDWFKFQEGKNRFRVLTEPEMIFEKYKVGICYTDCGYEGTPKFMCFVLDRKDEKIKLAKLPYRIGNQIASYEEDEDYTFDSYPMPYDITVNAKGAGTKEVEYSITPSPVRVPVSSEVSEAMAKKTPVPEIVAKLKEKKKQEHIEDGTWQAEQDRKAKLKADIEAEEAKEPTKKTTGGGVEYPDEEINPDDIPF